ncbi:hypothetical protein [Streptomyces anulatus]|uniref:hypothetical protein n=1 Tax=Streptomyces anulatus TaxID=1892 RepID=UPI001D188C28|nr:hypothetical protein [Streptomyces anulatus]
MDSTTLVGLAGIAGTLIGGGLGVAGTLLAARLTTRAADDLATRTARRQIYAACSAALLTFAHTTREVTRLLADRVNDQQALLTALERLQANQAAVELAAGAVAVEGPPSVMRKVEKSSRVVANFSLVLEGWASYDSETNSSQGRDLARQGRREVTGMQEIMDRIVEEFAAECQRTLHSKRQLGRYW